MSQYILINRIKVQNANAVAGFTWGFPAITHFLGFSHNLSRKLMQKEDFKGIQISGCAVIAHEQQVHTYGWDEQQFTQSRNPPYPQGLAKAKKVKAPPVIEEGKMNMTVSLLIQCGGNVSRKDELVDWLDNTCKLQRLAGGTILDIGKIDIFGKEYVKEIKRYLLPGFVLLDRSSYLQEHYKQIQKDDNQAEIFQAWIDFIALKQKARPKSDLINKHLKKITTNGSDTSQSLSDSSEKIVKLYEIWQKHLQTEYQQEHIPNELKMYFETLERNNQNKKLLQQWEEYSNPNEKTDANWEYLLKPQTGYLVPIMVGYKAISQVYQNKEVKNIRDNTTDVCFVESVHTIGEWFSVHRLNEEILARSVWHYHYEKNWYLCTQNQGVSAKDTNDTENPNEGF